MIKGEYTLCLCRMVEDANGAFVKFHDLVAQNSTSTNKAKATICPHFRNIESIPDDHVNKKYYSCSSNGKL